MKTNQSPLALAAIIFITCQLQVLAFQSIVGRGGHKPLSARPNPIENEKTITVPRRQLLDSVMASLLASTTIASIPSAASATVVGKPMSINVQSNSPEREALLQALSKKSSDEVVLRAIQNLIPLNPMKSKSSAKYASELDGEWRLLWYNKSDFSPLLKLPSPLRPDSFQYFGSVAEKEVGVGRVAQGLTGGILSALGPDKELWLSSGAVAKEDDPSILEIYPPFRFQLGDKPGSSAEKQTIIDSQSDADFRAVNARTTEAQMAPKNEYEQLYLENFGSGSLRISVVARGDPVIVGDMFVHQKI
jgi:hypothetical protein